MYRVWEYAVRVEDKHEEHDFF